MVETRIPVHLHKYFNEIQVFNQTAFWNTYSWIISSQPDMNYVHLFNIVKTVPGVNKTICKVKVKKSCYILDNALHIHYIGS